jgi:hypothetical protein
MALSSGVVSVGTAATQINGSSANPMKLHLANNDNSDALYVGDSGVTTTTGLVLAKLERIVFELNPGERIFAVSNKSGHSVSYVIQTF